MTNSSTKKEQLLFRIFMGIFSAQMLLSAGMYFFKNEIALEAFTKFGYPTYIIYPLGVAKVLGLIAIWSNKSKLLKNLAFSGFFFNMILAASAHLAIGEGPETIPSTLALIFLCLAFNFERKLNR